MVLAHLEVRSELPSPLGGTCRLHGDGECGALGKQPEGRLEVGNSDYCHQSGHELHGKRRAPEMKADFRATVTITLPHKPRRLALNTRGEGHLDSCGDKIEPQGPHKRILSSESCENAGSYVAGCKSDPSHDRKLNRCGKTAQAKATYERPCYDDHDANGRPWYESDTHDRVRRSR